MFRFIRKFDRAAVVAGKGWIRMASEIEGALIPSLERRSFDVNEKEKAET